MVKISPSRGIGILCHSYHLYSVCQVRLNNFQDNMPRAARGVRWPNNASKWFKKEMLNFIDSGGDSGIDPRMSQELLEDGYNDLLQGSGKFAEPGSGLFDTGKMKDPDNPQPTEFVTLGKFKEYFLKCSREVVGKDVGVERVDKVDER